MINRDHGEFDSTNFLLFLYNWRKLLFIVIIAAVVLSAIFSSPFFITPKYKSTVILFPVSSNSISKALLSENLGTRHDILEFGEEEQAEQMLQILNSNLIRSRIIQKYNLINHYGIDTTARYVYTKLFKEYEGNIHFRRTEYMAVEISVLDRDPQVAAEIANNIAALLDSTKNSMQKERAFKAFKIVEAEFLELTRQVHEMEDSLTFLRKKGVHDYESQSEMINQQLAIEIARNNTSGIAALEAKLDTLAKYGGPYVSLRDALEHEKKQLSLIKSKYEEARVDAEQELPQKFVVNTAYKAERKSYPVRWLIVAVTTIIAVILTVLVLIVIESIIGGGLKKKRTTIRRQDEHYEPVKSKIYEADPYKNEERSRNAEPPPAKPPPPQVNLERHENPVKYTKEYEQARPVQSVHYPNHIKTEEYMDFSFNNINLVNTLFRWKYHLIIIVFGAALLSVIFSSPVFITPKFKSYAIAYPGNVWPYSDESETEQMLQILNTADIRDSLIQKFNLAGHYKIDTSYKYYYSTMIYEFSQNVTIRKTENEAISIEVMDKDPQLATDMIYAMIDIYNRKVSVLHKEKFKQVLRNYEEVMRIKKHNLDSIQARLKELGQVYGLLDFESQTREITKGYLGTVDGAGANNINKKGVMELKKNMEDLGSELLILQELARSEADGYSELKLDYDQALLDYNRNYTHSNLISKPYPADKKSYPVRWLIVTLASIAAFMLAMILIAFLENQRRIKENRSK